jgi:hypothetical protein
MGCIYSGPDLHDYLQEMNKEVLSMMLCHLLKVQDAKINRFKFC